MQLHDSTGRAEFVEHAATADGAQLPRVTDQSQPPLVPLGQVHEVVEVERGQHAGLIDNERRPGRESIAAIRPTVGTRPFVQQLRNCVGREARFVAQHLRGLGCGSEPEGRPLCFVEIGRGSAEHGGLAGASWPDDEHEPIVSRHRCRGVGLERVKICGANSG